MTASRRPNPAFSFEDEGYPLFTSPRPSFINGHAFTFRVDQEFELAAKRRLRTELAASATAVGQLEIETGMRTLDLEVRRTFLTAVLAQEERTVAQASLDELDRVIALNRARFEHGEISGAELRRVQVERLRFVDDLFTAELALKNARSAVLALLGASNLNQPIDFVEPLALTADQRASLAAIAAGPGQQLAAAALGRRPDVAAVRREVTQAQTETRLQRALRTPNITLGGGLRRDLGANSVSFGLVVPLPLFNQNQGGIARADAERRAAVAHATSVESTARLEVQQALNAVETNRARVEYIEREHLKNARESRDLILESYRLGAADLIDFLDAQRAFRDTQRIYNRALYDERISRFELAAALGLPDIQ